MKNFQIVKKLLMSSAYGEFKMADYDTCSVCGKRYREDGAHEDICLAKQKAKEKKLQKTCEHSYEKFSGYAGTDYCCRICGKWSE